MVVKKKVAKKNNTGKIIAATVGVAALSAVGYLLMGPQGKKNRKDLKAWMVKMQAEVAEKMEDMKEVTADKYNDIVEQVSNKYSKLKNIDSEMVEKEVARLKKEWKNMSSSMKSGAKKKPTKSGTKK
jgi:gas vesicle protein